MGWAELAFTSLGTGGVVQLLNWWSGRGKNKADTSATQIDTMLRQISKLEESNGKLEQKYEKLELKYEKLEEERTVFRQTLYEHQQWDLEVYGAVLPYLPNFRPPPNLHP